MMESFYRSTEMKLYKKAKELLSIEEFSKKRCLAARALYHLAKGKEKDLIGSLFESQIVLANGPEEFLWLSKIDDIFKK